jgi:hypothetical protein
MIETTEIINLSTSEIADKIEKLHKEHEKVIREFKEIQPYFFQKVQLLEMHDQAIIYDLLKTATVKDMDEFKEHLKMPIRRDIIYNFSQILHQKMEDAVMSGDTDIVEKYMKKTKNFLIQYTGLHCAYYNHNQIE